MFIGQFDFAKLSIWNNKWYEIYDFNACEAKHYEIMDRSSSFSRLTGIECSNQSVPKVNGRQGLKNEVYK